jgi:hypothetical protein
LKEEKELKIVDFKVPPFSDTGLYLDQQIDAIYKKVVGCKGAKFLTAGEIKRVLVDMHHFPEPAWLNICRNLGYTDEEIYEDEEQEDCSKSSL